jgi:hypothetical protein
MNCKFINLGGESNGLIIHTPTVDTWFVPVPDWRGQYQVTVPLGEDLAAHLSADHFKEVEFNTPNAIPLVALPAGLSYYYSWLVLQE